MHRSSPLDSENCRSCTSFSDYFKSTKAKLKAEQNANELSNKSSNEMMEKPIRLDCPLDKDELGNATWGLLHTMASKYPDQPNEEQKRDMKQFFNLLGKFYPCEYCAKDLRKELILPTLKIKQRLVSGYVNCIIKSTLKLASQSSTAVK
ncbi:FAD-linked sulfhydryl oxidase ALR isoform X2 [Photinus pyralis]|uniref:FAD-linked sulfhydryl oxidase ALR isoform X2 n=1 Tax=Photinus pyralis TaxID=7054 RepID=UPI00126767D5|nr:FAD-linked sulfhydryl oxidase ALR isoform X2 [Photinus pyralis]